MEKSFRMECTVAPNYTNEQTKANIEAKCLSATKSEKPPGKSGLRVNFIEKGEVKERREKFLTAKYGTHQMNLIRKRLAVEMWLYEELQKLSTAACTSKEMEIDLDELLDMDDDDQRRQHVLELMPDIVYSVPEKVKEFMDELLKKMRTL